MAREERKEVTHPAFGVAGFSRVTGGPRKLFASTVEPQSTIRLRIAQAVYEHDLGRDWIHAHGAPFIEVEFSPAQFAELLTTMNVSEGVPCTILRKDGKSVDPIPEDEKAEVERVQDAFADKMKKLCKEMTEDQAKVEELLDKKSLSKADREFISGIFEKLHREVNSNTPFMLKSFEEASAKIVTQKKSEIDAFITHSIQVAGLEAIKNGTAKPLIGNEDDTQ